MIVQERGETKQESPQVTRTGYGGTAGTGFGRGLWLFDSDYMHAIIPSSSPQGNPQIFLPPPPRSNQPCLSQLSLA